MSKKLRFKNLIGQERIKDVFTAAFSSNSMGHAYLFCGEIGLGTFQTALEIALALHCDAEIGPCYKCPSCKLIMDLLHPDFNCLFPVQLKPEHKVNGDAGKLSEKGWKFIVDEIHLKMNDPYIDYRSIMGNVPVERIRELNNSILRGATRGEHNVAIIGDVDSLSPSSANAMLKSLEEPPPNTTLFLLTSCLHAVLPTIRSRCQIFRFGNLSTECIVAALCENSGRVATDPELEQAAISSDGSFGRALSLLNESMDEYAEYAYRYWGFCQEKLGWLSTANGIEDIINDFSDTTRGYADTERMLTSLLHLLRSIYFKGFNGSEKYIYKTVADIPDNEFNIKQVTALCSVCENAISAVRARGNILLVLSTLCIQIMEIINE